MRRKLLVDLIQRARRLDGLEQLQMSVVQDNIEATALYRSVGFQIYGVELRAFLPQKGLG